MGALSSGSAGYRSHRHRIASGDLGCFLSNQTSHPARILAAHADPAHLRPIDWSNIYPIRQLDSAGSSDHGCSGIRFIV